MLTGMRDEEDINILGEVLNVNPRADVVINVFLVVGVLVGVDIIVVTAAVSSVCQFHTL